MNEVVVKLLEDYVETRAPSKYLTGTDTHSFLEQLAILAISTAAAQRDRTHRM